MRALWLVATAAIALGALAPAARATLTSKSVAYVFDDTLFPCGSSGCGMNDSSFPGGSIFTNAVTGTQPGNGNTGAYTPSGGSQVTLTNVPLSTLDANAQALNGFDTAILYQLCNIGTPTNQGALAAINAFVKSGGKLMIFDADGCAPTSNGAPDWSGFVFPFATNNPGPLGASGSYTTVETSSLTTGLSPGPVPGDAVGDANVFTTYDPHWFQAIGATNANGVTGTVMAYARTPSGGLALYSGEDFWYTDGASPHLQQVFDDMLSQQWNPDKLPSTTRVFASQPIQQVVFVHGIRSDCEKGVGPPGSYAALYKAFNGGGLSTLSFCYADDNAFEGPGSHPIGSHPPLNSSRCFSDSSLMSPGSPSPVTSLSWNRAQATSSHGWQGPLSVTGGSVTPNDGNAALAYDAAKLDDCLVQLERWDLANLGRLVPIAVIGNSMGGAITRGWLALANSRSHAPSVVHSLDAVTTVVFLQGAVEGSWVAKVGEGVDTGLGNFAHLPSPLAAALSGAIDSEARNLATNADLNPTRPGVKDLVPGSGWYRSIVASGPPPALHYFAMSTDLHLNFSFQELFWTIAGPSTDFLGDGLMQLGNPAYNGRPAWGGSEFLPSGSKVDQHQFVFNEQVNATLDLTLGPGDLVNDGFVLGSAISAAYGSPYSHFNFGNQIGNDNAPSCASPYPTLKIPIEIGRILSQPSQACAAGGARDSAASLANSFATLTAASVPNGAQLNAVEARGNTTITFVDSRYDGQLSLSLGGGRARGDFVLTLEKLGVFTGRLPARVLKRHGTIDLNTTVRAVKGASALKIRLRGALTPATRAARLAITIGHRHLLFVTATPPLAKARATARKLVGALRANNLAAVVALLPPQLFAGQSAQQVATQLAAAGVHITSIVARGNGRLGWLSNGSPVYLQPVLATANTPQGRVSRRAILVFIYEHGVWRLLAT